jgi:hypothetical protein
MTTTRWNHVVEWASRERFLVGASLLRIIAGLTILYQYLINYAQRHYLYGPDGVWPWDVFVDQRQVSGVFSLYAWSRSPLFFELMFHLGLVVTAIWVVGFRTRCFTALTYVFWTSLHERFNLLWDGGDNVLQIVLLYALFAELGARFSIDAATFGERAARSPRAHQARMMMHGAAMLAIALQISLVYGIAGLTKVQGETWRNGTAIYYAMRGGEFYWPGRSDYVYQHRIIVTLLSYATVAFQVSFPYFLFLNRRTRTIALVAGLFFHAGIAVFMGLITFASFLMAVDMSLIGDDEYSALARLGRRLAARVLGRRAFHSATATLAGGLPAKHSLESSPILERRTT